MILRFVPLSGTTSAKLSIHYDPMIAVTLLMIVGGIGLSQAVSDPHQVTLRWLRLGGIIALSLLGVTAMVMRMAQLSFQAYLWSVWLSTTTAFAIQLIATQLKKHQIQRLAGALGCLSVCIGVPIFLLASANQGSVWVGGSVIGPGRLEMTAVVTTGSGLLGGFLMTMLLGHAYLTAGNEMTQSPFRRLVLMLAMLLVLRAVVGAVFGVWPFLQSDRADPMEFLWNVIMISARFAVGLIVPGIFVYMIDDCVRRRANQSATGILYVATVLVILGEGIAFVLMGSVGYVF